MSDQPSQEAVFCHECGNRWPRNEGGLTCPACQSEFVEILEEQPEVINQHDRRQEQSPGLPSVIPALFRPLGEGHQALPGGNVTHHQYRSQNGRLSYTTTTYRSPGRSPGVQESPRTSPFAHDDDPIGPLFQNFNNIIQGIAANNALPDGRPARYGQVGPRDPHTRSPNHYPNPFDDPAPPDEGPSPQHDQRREAAGNPENPFDALFHDIENIRARRRPEGAPPPYITTGGAHPLAAMIGQLLGMTRSGDAVYSQEEFDRVMSQLMAQTSGTAPGPASEEAIESLPKKKIDSSMVGDDGKAECSICMDRAPIGTEVTVLPCEHWFHDGCIKAWLHEHDTCPHCRRGITEGPTEENQDQSSGAAGNAPPGSRTNPYVLNESPPPSGFSPPNPAGTSNAGGQHSSRSEEGGPGNSGSRGLAGWMRNHFGGNSD